MKCAELWLCNVDGCPCKKSGHSDTQFIHLFVVEIIFSLHWWVKMCAPSANFRLICDITNHSNSKQLKRNSKLATEATCSLSLFKNALLLSLVHPASCVIATLFNFIPCWLTSGLDAALSTHAQDLSPPYNMKPLTFNSITGFSWEQTYKRLCFTFLNQQSTWYEV